MDGDPAPVRSIRRLLIANRGEIVGRIARTAHRMGIDTVGVHSMPDATAFHVDAVDRSVALGGATPAESYLRADAIVDAALDAGCDAVHPGYGFLAESSSFARAVVDAGLVWVGPTPEQIATLGDKQAAIRRAAELGVPTAGIVEAAPGEDIADVPLPALVKAAAGGGGRGMRIVRSSAELRAAIDAATREAEAAFGDGTVFIEPYREHVRHVEVQIIGDAHGALVHLGDRECSIQRRSQKLIEEAPCAGITEETRRILWEGALTLGASVGYRSAGTVEFLVGDDGAVTFLEVNTRLQVEHPVTEAVTGLDLIELQILVAEGRPLPITQDDVRFDGHAIEVRLVAEDPAAGWLPSTGTLAAFEIDGGVRVDAGVRSGSEVSPHYDSLLAKIVAHGSDRRRVAAALSRTIRAAHIGGVATNRRMLAATLEDPDFLAATTTTRHLDEHPHITAASLDEGERDVLLAAAVVRRATADRIGDPWAFVPNGWRNLWTLGERSTWTDGAGSRVALEERWEGDDRITLLVGDWPSPTDSGALSTDERRSVEVEVGAVRPDEVLVEVDGVRHRVRTTRTPDGAVVTSASFGGETWNLEPRFVATEATAAGSGPVSPLPGRIVSIDVVLGQRVVDGDQLLVVEAMKMEHRIVASHEAVVTAIRFEVGDRVDAGDLLVELAHDA
jgi:propionyl-CoA carboxylase alpha chain